MASGGSKEQTVIAIEIGSVNCGFAYSLGTTCREIYSENHGIIHPNDRFPSKFLLKNDWTLTATGTTAADKYRSYALLEEHEKYIYFDSVNVSYDRSQEVCIEDHRGLKHDADKLFNVIVKHLYDQCIDTIKAQTGLNPTNIKLILTIPSTDYDDLWKIIHSAALNTCLPEESVSIFLEKDTVAFYCRQQLLSINVYEGACTIPRETSIALANIGGTKTEICANTNTVSIPFGGVSVSKIFMEELRLFLGIGETKWTELQKMHICDVMDVIKEFEKIRNKFDRSKEFEIIELPPSFIDASNTEEKSKSAISFLKSNKILLQRNTMETLFNEVLQEIVKGLGNVSVDTIILLSGWFSENPYVRDYIATKMKSNKVILVPYPSLAVLKGSVMMGYEQCRTAEFSYGIEIRKPFKAGQDPENLRERRSNIEFCSSHFVSFIKKNKPLENGKVLFNGKLMFCLKHDHEAFFLNFYKSDNKSDPKYCTDEGCYCFKEIKCAAPDGGWHCQTSFTFKLTIIYVDNNLLVKIKSKDLLDIEERYACK